VWPIFFLLEISFRQLRLCYFVAPSLTRGRVCNLLVQLHLGLAWAVTLGSKSRRTHDHILLSHLRLPPPGAPGFRIYIPQEQGVPVIPPGHWVPFLSPLTTRRDYDGGILTSLHTGQRRSTFFYMTYINSVRTSQETQYISDLQPGTLTTRPQGWPTFFYKAYINSVRTSQKTIHLRSVARNSDNYTTEVVCFLLHHINEFNSYLTKHSTSPFCSQELWTLDYRGGLLSST
jgi:hypothetical protein